MFLTFNLMQKNMQNLEGPRLGVEKYNTLHVSVKKKAQQSKEKALT